jgi:hypothetical protein
MGATCSNKIPALVSEFPCPKQDFRSIGNEHLRLLMTIDAKCPVCKSDGYKVEVEPILIDYPLLEHRIQQFDITITRPCGHAKREFSIGF